MPVVRSSKLIGAVIHPKVLLIPYINQTIIRPPTVSVNHAIKADTASNYRQQRPFLRIRDYLSIYPAILLLSLRNISLTERTLNPVKLAVSVAVKSSAKHPGNRRNLASLILENL